MRVIAGSAGGIRLAVPKRGVRPTMDRVKAAIFSSLGEAVVGARILDLFAGSGALGIEALSRGACSAVFAEEDGQSAEIIERNLAKTKLKGRVRQQDVFDFLRHACGLILFLPIRPTKKLKRVSASPKNCWQTKICLNYLAQMGLLFWRNARLNLFLKQICGISFARRNMAQRKFCFCNRFAIRNSQSAT
jgi:hypothetical protein